MKLEVDDNFTDKVLLLKDIMRKQADEIAATARLAMQNKNGALANSISVENNEDGSYSIASDAEYAPYVEFGTSRSGAKPFLFPALISQRSKLKASCIDAIRRLK